MCSRGGKTLPGCGQENPMKCRILHETKGRLRVHLCIGRMTLRQADLLEYSMRAVDGVASVKVYDRTQDLSLIHIL